MRALLALLAASLATLALSLPSADPSKHATESPSPVGLGRHMHPAASPLPPSLGQARRALAPPLRVACGRPRTLRLRRFEDGSAWLLCAGRVLARVAVPG